MHAGRMRRIVKYPRWAHHSDVNVPPQWMQWLRHTRFEPPSLAEQKSDLIRQEQIKYLAAQADARWASKPSVLDSPDRMQPMQMLQSRHEGSGMAQQNIAQEHKGRATPSSQIREEIEDARDDEDDRGVPTLKERKVMRKEPKDSPWKQAARGNPSDEWQPQEWKPAPAKRRS